MTSEITKMYDTETPVLLEKMALEDLSHIRLASDLQFVENALSNFQKNDTVNARSACKSAVKLSTLVRTISN